MKKPKAKPAGKAADPPGSGSDRISLLSLVVSALAFAVSGYTTYRQFWPSDDTQAIVTQADWSIQDSHLGRGPQLVAAISFVNAGNRPVILSTISVAFGYSALNREARTCNLEDGTWTAFAWDKTFDGERAVTATPKAIPSQVATTAVYVFLTGNILGERFKNESEIPLKVCLSYEAIGYHGKVEVRAPLGVLTISTDRVNRFDYDKDAREPTSIVH